MSLSLVCAISFYVFLIFFFNDTATTEIYTLSLHDALPIFQQVLDDLLVAGQRSAQAQVGTLTRDRKSTRLNSSHVEISYAVFCLKKKKKQIKQPTNQKYK